MTRIVVMDDELHEAITVVEISALFMREMEAGERPRWIYLIPTSESVSATQWDYKMDAMTTVDIVRLRLEMVRRGRELRPLFWYAYADDPELALRLRAAFLPGQLGEVQRREKEAWWRGVFAVAKLG